MLTNPDLDRVWVFVVCHWSFDEVVNFMKRLDCDNVYDGDAIFVVSHWDERRALRKALKHMRNFKRGQINHTPVDEIQSFLAK